jgi:hypothetical protein
MSALPHAGGEKITVPELLQRKSNGGGDSPNKKITCLTAYDYPTARLLDEAGVDVLLVGDSLGMVMLGHESTLPVTLEDMLRHTAAVRRGTKRALWWWRICRTAAITSDNAESLRNAVRFIKEAGAEAVKIEGGERRLELIVRLTEAEIPVMAHVGLTPQSVNALGGYRVQGKTVDAGGADAAGCARGGSGGGVRRGAGGGAARTGGANYARAAHPDDWHWRRAGLRRADPGAARFAGTEFWPYAEIYAAICGRGRNYQARGTGILRGCAWWVVSVGCGVVSRRRGKYCGRAAQTGFRRQLNCISFRI